VRRTQSGTVAHATPLPERRPSNPSLPARPISAPVVEAPFDPAKPTVVFESPKLRPGSSGRVKVPVTTPPASPIGGSLPPRAKKNMPATRSLLEAGAGRYSMATPENATTSAYQRASQPPDGKSVKPERPDPEACFARAERLMKQREYAAALQAANEALRLGGDRAEHEALYAWLLCLQGSDTELRVHPRAMQHLDRALRRDPLCERANHYKGMVLKRLGRFDEAHNYFLRAMQVNRDNLEAAREVRLYDMRKRNRDSRPSLVNKLLKKFGDDE
jgi:tetratricopeptide (TPR) repeat protein